MWNRFSSFVLWLHEPGHVARFQRYFGIVPSFNSQPDLKEKSYKSDSTLNQNQDIKNRKPSVPNGLNHVHHEKKLTYDTNVLDECIDEIEHSAHQKESEKNSSSDIDYKITSWFWYYFFQFGSSIGNEIFYIIFFPAW